MLNQPILPDEKNILPKYYRLKQTLRQKISEMEAGSLLPSEAELCKAFEISRTTVRKALTDLNQEGLIYSYQGKGTFVAPKKVSSNWAQQSGGFYADMSERGFEISMQVLEKELQPAGDSLAKELKLNESDLVFKLVRLRFVDGKPFDICTNYLPAALFPGFEDENLEEGSLYTLMKTKYQIRFEHGRRLLEADAATTSEARLLQIRPHTPLLVMRSTMYDVRGLAVEHGVARQRCDFSQIVIDVTLH